MPVSAYLKAGLFLVAAAAALFGAAGTVAIPGFWAYLAIFAVAVIIAILAAFVTTIERIETRTASNESPPGTTGLAKPRPPLDRAPGGR